VCFGGLEYTFHHEIIWGGRGFLANERTNKGALEHCVTPTVASFLRPSRPRRGQIRLNIVNPVQSSSCRPPS